MFKKKKKRKEKKIQINTYILHIRNTSSFIYCMVKKILYYLEINAMKTSNTYWRRSGMTII